MTHDPDDRATWTCDKCGLPILPDSPVYTIADDPEAGRGRHYACHAVSVAEWEEARARMPELIDKLPGLNGKLKNRL